MAAKAPSDPPANAPKHECCHSSSSVQKAKFDWLFWFSLLAVLLLFIRGQWFNQVIVGDWLDIMTDTVMHMLGSMWWGVLIGMLSIGLLAKVPQVFIISLLGQPSSYRGLVRATLAGVLLDLCSHGILMVASKLYQKGASAGQMVAFLLASPWNSFSLTLILIGLIGLKLTVIFIVLSAVIAFISGWLFDLCVKHQLLPTNPNSISVNPDFAFFAQAKIALKATQFNWQWLGQVMLTGIKDSKMVVRWLLFGILLAGLLRLVLDEHQFVQYFSPTVVGLGVSLLLATVLEICSEGSAPIAADIINRAQAPGNGFAFLMAGVATDYTEIMVIKDTSQSWKFALFLPLISVPQILFVAWLVNAYG
ncbi:permease [Paraferrimonas sp. SM1919]|uniref:permease n=1 Tax=Paraferrimonas sp. SM1919 TaxID=2662263 RepID=UPI0013D60CE4|nr:permease [Paraferrimonas sp. SM1919]